MKLSNIYKKLLLEKIMGGEASEIIFSDIKTEYLDDILKIIKKQKKMNFEFLESLSTDIIFEYENKTTNEFILTKLLSDIIDKDGNLRYDKIYSKNRKINIKEIKYFIINIGLTFNPTHDTEYRHTLTELSGDTLTSTGLVNIGIDYDNSYNRLIQLFRHEYQHFVQFTINYFKG